jgi:hypothetical protein
VFSVDDISKYAVENINGRKYIIKLDVVSATGTTPVRSTITGTNISINTINPFK